MSEIFNKGPSQHSIGQRLMSLFRIWKLKALLLFMASFTKNSSDKELGAVVIAGGLLIIAFLNLVPITGGVELSNWGKGTRGVKIGSSPPRCTVDKCLNCRPCMATLIAPIHQRKQSVFATSSEHDTYYLLAWKCKCGNKIYHP